nr:pentatricopeptide repeat-containing protein At1g59720, chloroplastic/mitochondrial-like [Ipomoea batatas]
MGYAKQLISRIPSPGIYSYNSLIRGFLENSQASSPEPILIFKRLLRKNYPRSNTFTFAFVLKSCSVLMAFREGQQLHKHVVQSGHGSSPFVQTSLLNFYAKCEEIELSQKVFDEIPERNVVAWSAMISGYSRLGMANQALDSFREMQKAGISPDRVTLVSAISACAISGALDLGKWLHAYIDKKGIENDLELNTALVNMYVKCGCVEKAKEVFESMPVKDVKAWGSMIYGLAINGLAEDALNAFSRMGETKVEPNHVTLVGVLMACAHSGLVSEGKKYWSSMIESGIEPSLEHYGLMVDLFCRSNLIEDAYSFVESMPIPQNPAILRSLLVACKKKKILDRGEVTAKRLIELEPQNAENYILLSSLYASVSDWERMREVRKQMKDKDIKTVPGCSSIEVDGFVHEFVMGDWSHPEAEELKGILSEISDRVRGSGHEPWISGVLHDTSDEEKEHALCEHSERLAIAYGLLRTEAPTVIRVVKNLRVCRDCHEVTKIISMTLEDMFRAKYRLKKEDDLFQLIEAALMVAVLEKKAEFHKRKARITHILNTERADDDGELPQITPPVAAAAVNRRSVASGANAKPEGGLRESMRPGAIAQENNNKRNGIQEKQRPREKGLNQEKEGNGIYEQKLVASERKLEKRYRDIEKSKRKIQLLEFKDAPKLESIGRVAKKIRF